MGEALRSQLNLRTVISIHSHIPTPRFVQSVSSAPLTIKASTISLVR
jgi:hypothetical protein